MMGVNMSESTFNVVFDGDATQGWMHSGICLLSGNRIVFESPGGHGLIIFDLVSGKYEKILVDIAVAHGITSTFESGTDFIWICDPGVQAPGKVVKINLKGEIVRELQPPSTSPLSKENWRPTSLAATANGDLWVADGYGLNLVHRYSPSGEVITLDGSESGLLFNCPHGLAIDNREGKFNLAVADRRNKRVILFDQEGKYIRAISAEIMTSPSSITSSGSKLFVTDLRGAILSISIEDEVDAVISSTQLDGRPGWPNELINGETVAPTIESGKINSPHGIVSTPAGSIYVTEWYFGGRVISID